MKSLAGQFRRALPLALLVLLALPDDSHAALATFYPSKDNTLFQNDFEEKSDGAGETFFVGLTGQPTLRRGLIAFDLSSIPSGVTIESVMLSLYCYQVPPAGSASDVSLHVATKSWGEGTSDSDPFGGKGTTPSTGDATWNYRFYPGSPWTNPGGDMRATPDATTTVGDQGSFYNWTSATMVTTVQNWVNGTAVNNGWIVVGDESTPYSAKSFASRNNTTMPATYPLLTVTYSSVPEPGVVSLLAAAGALGLSTTRRRRPSLRNRPATRLP